jgi:phenylalanine-4-hydroxylase
VASKYRLSDPHLPHVNYTEDEKKTWEFCW